MNVHGGCAIARVRTPARRGDGTGVVGARHGAQKRPRPSTSGAYDGRAPREAKIAVWCAPSSESERHTVVLRSGRENKRTESFFEYIVSTHSHRSHRRISLIYLPRAPPPPVAGARVVSSRYGRTRSAKTASVPGPVLIPGSLLELPSLSGAAIQKQSRERRHCASSSTSIAATPGTGMCAAEAARLSANPASANHRVSPGSGGRRSVGVLFRAPASVEYIEFYACVCSSDNPSQGSPSRSLKIHCREDQSRFSPSHGDM